MKYVGDLTHVEGDIYQVGLIHNMPFDAINGLKKAEEELNASGVLVDDVPEAEAPDGMQPAGIFVNRATKEVFWRYEETPITPEEQQKADLDFLAAMIGVEL